MTVSPNSLQSPLYEDEEKKVLGTVNSGWAQAGGQFAVPSSQFPVPFPASIKHLVKSPVVCLCLLSGHLQPQSQLVSRVLSGQSDN